MVGKRSATAPAALQLHCATPKRFDDTTRRGHVKRNEPSEDVRSSRFRLLDEREQACEAQEIEKIVRGLQAQRRPRSATQQPRQQQQRPSGGGKAASRTSSGRVASGSRTSMAAASPRSRYGSGGESPPAYDPLYASSTAATMKRRASVDGEPASPQWTEGEDEAAPESDDEGKHDGDDRGGRASAAVAPLPSTTFQEQVLRELQKLKQAQQADLAAIQRLQREKEDAERKARALETALRRAQSQSQQQTRPSRPAALVFEDLSVGDESAPPPQPLAESPLPPYRPRDDWPPETRELDFTDGEDSQSSAGSSPDGSRGRWATMSSTASSPSSRDLLNIQRSQSPMLAKARQRQGRPSSARSSTGSLRLQRASAEPSHQPRSARSRRRDGDRDSDDDEPGEREEDASRGRSAARRGSVTSCGTSRGRSASRDKLRRSCAFFEEKQREQHEEEERLRDSQRKLDRAARATPPANLLKRQEEAQRRKREQLARLEKERLAELSPAKRVHAREVPTTTYLATDAFATNEEREQARQARLAKRSQELLAHAELPSRMKQAQEQQQARAKAMEAAATAAASLVMAVSVKARRQLEEKLQEEEARRQRRKPKPVPDFAHLQTQWEKALSTKKSQLKATEPQGFFSSREKEREALRARKEARKRKMAEQDERERREDAERQRALLEKVQRSGGGGGGGRADGGPRLTRADELRMRKVQAALRQERRATEQEQMETERRELRLKEASRRVAAQVRHGESKRKGEYAGEFVELTSVESLAKEKAKKQREQFREAVQRNKERLVQAVATKPSLMERFAIDLQREEHRKNALEAVVKQVFAKNLKDMKGILTEDEEELARDLVAADEEAAPATADSDGGETSTAQKKKKKKKAQSDAEEEEEEEKEEAADGDDA